MSVVMSTPLELQVMWAKRLHNFEWGHEIKKIGNHSYSG